MFEVAFGWILVTHFIGDFVLQTDWMAQNKSKNWEALSAHVQAYGSALTLGLLPLFMIVSFKAGMIGAVFFLVINTLAHFATDAVTSRWTSALWAKGDRHNFFVVIGLDQLIHSLTLLITLRLILL
jgi:hypothetical protein